MSVGKRTQKEIMDYIKTHSEDGKLTKSLLDIAKEIGYSNATIHRALRALNEKGLIEVAASAKPTEPNTIVYKGSKNEIDELLAKGVQITQNIEALNNQVNDYMEEVNWFLRKLNSENDKLRQQLSQKDDIVSVQEIPGSDLQIITMRKRSPETQA